MPKKILFIEDETDLVLMVRTRLEANGFKMVSAGDGEAGLKMADEEKPDLILLDLQIPKIHGFEVCKRLKQDPKTRGVPVMIFTVSAGPNLEDRCRAVGAEACLRKPFEASHLLATMKELLRG